MKRVDRRTSGRRGPWGSLTPAARPWDLAGHEVVSMSSVSPAEVPPRSSQETVALPAVALKTEQLR